MVQFFGEMGQYSSVPKPGRRKSLRSFRRSSASNNNISHTFTINDNNTKYELVNINLASEEELMTLAGVNREIARNIVDHRKAIGRFRKVEDLALVRGIGAEKLERIRPEIAVSSRRIATSSVSSRAQSYDSLKSTDSRLTVKSNKLVNINKANVFELQSVHGITQEIAAGIIHYREKKGPFKRVEDLIKVKNIDRVRLDNINRFLTVEATDNEEDSEVSRPNLLTNGHCTTLDRRCNGGPIKLSLSNGLSNSVLLDIFELLSAYSPRPIIEDIFRYSRNEEPAVRIATWNLHDFSFDKASNLGVKEVVCRTILENGWSIVAVQDVVDASALKVICDELNRPQLKRVEEWPDRSHHWNFCMLDVSNSRLGFIYDSDGDIEIDLVSLDQGPIDVQTFCEVLVASFNIGTLSLQVVNLKLKKRAKILTVDEKIKELLCEGDTLLLSQDCSNVLENTGPWCNIGGLQSVLPAAACTTYLTSKAEIYKQPMTNILTNSKAAPYLTGLNGVVRQGLTHLAIPNGWNWGGPVSPFCPVWVELFLNTNTGTTL